MSANMVLIAQAVVTLLNGSSFSQPFTAERHYAPNFELPSMATLRVSVVPRSSTNKAHDRTRDSFDYELDVAVQQRTDLSLPNLDGLMQLSEEIADCLRLQPLASLPEVRCMGVATSLLYASEHLRELRVFTSVITATYRKLR